MGGLDKLFYDLYGQPVLARTLLALDRCDRIDEIVVAARQENILRIGEPVSYTHLDVYKRQ